MKNLLTKTTTRPGIKNGSFIFIISVCITTLVVLTPAEKYEHAFPQSAKSSTEKSQPEKKNDLIPDWVGITGFITALGTIVINLKKNAREEKSGELEYLKKTRDELQEWFKEELTNSRDQVVKLREILIHKEQEIDEIKSDRDDIVTSMRTENERLKTMTNQTQLLISVMKNTPDSISYESFQDIGYR